MASNATLVRESRHTHRCRIELLLALLRARLAGVAPQARVDDIDLYDAVLALELEPEEALGDESALDEVLARVAGEQVARAARHRPAVARLTRAGPAVPR